jgi:polyisoprenoid-binding protein YceI
VHATIDCATLNTGVAKRDEQARKLKIAGDLTINATTRPVTLDVDGPSAEVRDAQGRTKIGLSAATKISRKEFGIIWNEVLKPAA